MDNEDIFIFMCSPEECDSFTTIDETVIVGESDVHHGADDDLSVPHHGPLEHAVHAEDGGLGWVDDGSSEQGAKHSAVTDGEGASVHVLHSQLVILGFLSQRGDTFLNVGVAHGLNVS